MRKGTFLFFSLFPHGKQLEEAVIYLERSDEPKWQASERVES